MKTVRDIMGPLEETFSKIFSAPRSDADALEIADFIGKYTNDAKLKMLLKALDNVLKCQNEVATLKTYLGKSELASHASDAEKALASAFKKMDSADRDLHTVEASMGMIIDGLKRTKR
jgi:hypothetical protein